MGAGTDVKPEINRELLNLALGWHANGFVHRSVLAAGILGSSPIWLRPEPQLFDYVGFVSAFLAVLVLTVTYPAVANLAEIILCADERVVHGTLDDNRNQRRWRAIKLIGWIQMGLILVAAVGAISAFLDK